MNVDRIIEILSDIRAETEEIELILNEARAADQASLPVFDPGSDTPPVRPLVDGSRLQQDWCGLVLWASLRAINVREGRAATPEESVSIAKAAGYRDGRGWNAWTLGWEKDADGGRWITEDGMIHLRNYYDAVGRRIPDDLA